MKASITTLDLIRKADEATIAAAKSGVTAVLSLIRENIGEKFPHGAASELASLLKDGKVSQHTAKRYADITVLACKAIALQANLASGKVKQAEKATTKQASVEDNLATLASMTDMRKIRIWANENGPKAKEKTMAPAADAPAADAPAAEAPIAPNLEALGQMREIRECLAMINAGQVTPGEALATIATIAGIQLAKSLPAPAGKAKAKAKALPKAG